MDINDLVNGNGKHTELSAGDAKLHLTSEEGVVHLSNQGEKTNTVTISDNKVGLNADVTIGTDKGLTLTKGNATLTEGDATLTKGDLTLTEGDATLTKGDLTLTEGNLSMTQTVTAGEQLFSFSKFVDIDVAAADTNTKTGTGNIVQPAGTTIKAVYIKNSGSAAATISGNADNAGVTIQLGVTGDTDSIAGPATASATTGNIIDAATANDAQSWPANGIGQLYSGYGTELAAANSFTHLNANLDAVAMTVAVGATQYSSSERTILATISSISASSNVPINAQKWRVIIEFEYI